MMLGYLLARAGVDVAMLEKPADFFRDFRGDTIHPSTLSRKLFERFLRDVNKLPGAPAWAGRRPQGPTRQTQFGTPQPAPEAQCTTLGVSGRKGVLPPGSAAPTSTSSIDTAVETSPAILRRQRFREAMHQLELVRVCALWDRGDIERESVMTVIEFIDDDKVLDALAEQACAGHHEVFGKEQAGKAR